MSFRGVFALVILSSHLAASGSYAQVVVSYPPLVTNVAAHNDVYNQPTATGGKSQTRVTTRQKSVSARRPYVKNPDKAKGWDISSNLVTSAGFALAAVIALGLASIFDDDDESSSAAGAGTSSTSTTTSTE
jgi:hypothetical protein